MVMYNHAFLRAFSVLVAFVFLVWALFDDNWFKSGACTEGLWRLCCDGHCSNFDGNGEEDAAKWILPLAAGLTGLLFVLTTVQSVILLETKEPQLQCSLRSLVHVAALSFAVTGWALMYGQRYSAIKADDTDSAYATWIAFVAWLLLAIDLVGGNFLTFGRVEWGYKYI